MKKNTRTASPQGSEGRLTQIAALLCEEIQLIDLYENDILSHPPRWTPTHRDLLIVILKRGVITHEQLTEAVARRVIAIGQLCFEQHRSTMRSVNKCWPDHTVSPGAFGYAIARGAFTEEELAQIRFDHDDTLQRFARSSEAQSIVEDVTRALLSEPVRSTPAHALA